VEFIYPARVKAGVLLITASALFSSVAACLNIHIFAQNPVDTLTLYSRRFEELRKSLPAHGTIGYVSDEAGDEATWDYYRTQYALAPLIVEQTTEHDFVVGNFREGGGAGKIPANSGLILLKDFGNGAVVFGRKLK
jgi:hypothetical protein